ncbi:MAG: DUF362 domain-containing protein [Bryobacteraceae bacterium]|nr:DUF362 domain-containing protein [Bryobacteraceae bacterium]
MACLSRRSALQLVGGGVVAGRAALQAAATATVAVARCRTYGAELAPTMAKMFDQLGGLAGMVKGKTVAIKVNMTGGATWRLGTKPAELTHYTHPATVGVLIDQLGRAGARRVRVLESAFQTGEPLEEFMYESGWDVAALGTAAGRVEFENTNNLGKGSKYVRMAVPGGGLLFPSYELNHSYHDCDFLISLAKLKEHVTAGITLSMKNMFGITPCTIYGDGSPKDEPSEDPKGGRGAVFHNGERQPAKIAAAELDAKSPRDAGYRVVRAVVDLCAARPVDLAIVDGIETMAGGEGPWCGPGMRHVAPGVLVAGRNCVSTDAVGAAIMGFDPITGRGRPPFEGCDSTLELGEARGLGTRDLKKIEVVGTSIREVLYLFRRTAGA